MTDRIAYFRDWQVIAALEGRLSALFVPMRKQPGVGIDHFYQRPDGLFQGIHLPAPGGGGVGLPRKSPFAPGDTLLCKEAWAAIWPEHAPDGWMDDNGAERPIRDDECDIVYRADHPGEKYPGEWPDDCSDDPNCGRWRSPTHMSREAVRITFTVKSVAAAEIRKVTQIDFAMTGIGAEMVDSGGSDSQGYWIDIPRYDRIFEADWKTRYQSRYPWDTAWAWRVEVE